jgi:hypothetical protein
MAASTACRERDCSKQWIRMFKAQGSAGQRFIAQSDNHGGISILDEATTRKGSGICN